MRTRATRAAILPRGSAAASTRNHWRGTSGAFALIVRFIGAGKRSLRREPAGGRTSPRRFRGPLGGGRAEECSGGDGAVNPRSTSPGGRWPGLRERGPPRGKPPPGEARSGRGGPAGGGKERSLPARPRGGFDLRARRSEKRRVGNGERGGRERCEWIG